MLKYVVVKDVHILCISQQKIRGYKRTIIQIFIKGLGHKEDYGDIYEENIKWSETFMDTNILDNGPMPSLMFNHDGAPSEYSFLPPFQKHCVRVADADAAQGWMGID